MDNIVIPVNEFYAVLVSSADDTDLTTILQKLIDKMNDGDGDFVKKPIPLYISLLASSTDNAEITLRELTTDMSIDDIFNAGCEEVSTLDNYSKYCRVEANASCLMIDINDPDYEPITAILTKDNLIKLLDDHVFSPTN